MKTKGGVLDLLGRPGFGSLLAGQTASGFGDWMATVALMALVLKVSGSSADVGVILVLRLAPATVAGPLATRLVRRWNRRRTMLATDLARTAIVLAIPAVWALWWIFLWVFLLEVCGLIFLPARDAAVPELVPEEQLPTANGLVMASSYGTIPVGAGVFALVAALLGHGGSRATYWAVFGIDAVTFLVSFAAIWRINRFQSARFEAEARSEPRTSFLQALRMPIVRSAAPAVLATCLGLGCLFSLGIVFVRKVLGASNAGFSGLIALFGVGAAVGLVTVRVLPGQRLRMIKWALIAQGATVAGMSLAPDLALTFVGAIAFGATTTIALANAVTELQECLEGPQRVMGFAVFHVAIRSGLAVAAVVAGFLADRLRTVSWPVLGHLPPARLVLLASGLVVVAGGFFFGAGRFRLEDSGTRAGGN